MMGERTEILAEPYKIKMVEPIKIPSPERRKEAIKEAVRNIVRGVTKLYQQTIKQ